MGITPATSTAAITFSAALGFSCMYCATACPASVSERYAPTSRRPSPTAPLNKVSSAADSAAPAASENGVKAKFT